MERFRCRCVDFRRKHRAILPGCTASACKLSSVTIGICSVTLNPVALPSILLKKELFVDISERTLRSVHTYLHDGAVFHLVADIFAGKTVRVRPDQDHHYERRHSSCCVDLGRRGDINGGAIRLLYLSDKRCPFFAPR